MAENLQDIDDLFRAGLENSEDEPSSAVWKGIEKNLNNPVKPASPGKLTWLKGLSVAASLIIMVSAIYFASKNPGASMQKPGTMLNIDEIKSVESGKQKNRMQANRISGIQNSVERITDTAIGYKNLHTNAHVKTGEIKSHKDPADLNFAENTAKKNSNLAHNEANKNNININKQVASARQPNNFAPKNTNSDKNNLKSKNHLTAKENIVILRPSIVSSKDKIVKKQSFNENGEVKSTYPKINEQISFENSLVKTQIHETNPAKSEWTIIDQKKLRKPVRTDSASLNNLASVTNAIKLKPALIPKFSITPVVMINISKNKIQENRSFGGRNGREHKEFRQTEQSKTTISPGIFADFRLSRVLSLQTGISELKNNISISPKKIPAIRDNDGKVRYRLDCSAGSYFIDPKMGTAPQAGDTINISASEIKLNYASVPVSVKFNAGNKKIRYYGLAGIDYNFLINKSSSTVLQGNLDEKLASARTEGLKFNYFNGVIGGGIDIMVSKNIAFSIMPQFRFAIKSINEKSPVNSFPKSISFISGLKYSF